MCVELQDRRRAKREADLRALRAEIARSGKRPPADRDDWLNGIGLAQPPARAKAPHFQNPRSIGQRLPAPQQRAGARVRPFGPTAVFAADQALPEAFRPKPRPRAIACACLALSVFVNSAAAFRSRRATGVLAAIRSPNHAPSPASSRDSRGADIVDRNGVLARHHRPRISRSPPNRAVSGTPPKPPTRCAALFPELDRATTIRRLSRQFTRSLVLSPPQPHARASASKCIALGLGGIGFEAEDRRVYPQNDARRAHARFYRRRPQSALRSRARAWTKKSAPPVAAGRARFSLSLDVRMQFALDRRT